MHLQWGNHWGNQRGLLIKIIGCKKFGRIGEWLQTFIAAANSTKLTNVVTRTPVRVTRSG